VESFNYTGSKLVANGSVKEDITGKINSAGNLYQLVRYTL
jgi:hypothetical protein